MEAMNTMSQVILITGASGGIGKELAKLFARDGFNLVLVSRSGDELQKVAKELRNEGAQQVEVIAMDLAKEGTSTKLFEILKKKKIEIEVLVNNVGFGMYGKFWQIDEKNRDGRGSA